MVKHKVQVVFVHEGHLQVYDEWSIKEHLEHVFLTHDGLCLFLANDVLLLELLDCNELLGFFLQG